MIEDVLFVVNPRAASGRAARVWSALCDRVRSLRHASVVQCGEAVSAAAAIRAALTPRFRRVVALGGDGTLHCTLNLLLADPDRERSLGLIPVGTGSDLARCLGLETRPDHALAQALESAPSRLDALRLDGGAQPRYFINELSFGISSPVAARVNALARRNTATFLAAAVRELVNYQPRWARIDVDGKPWREGFFYLAVVANGQYFARGMRIAPDADPTDGQADVVVVEAVPKWRALTWLPSIYIGRHLAAPFVHHVRARSVAIEAGAEPAAFEGDGEVTRASPARITLEPGAVLFTGSVRR